MKIVPNLLKAEYLGEYTVKLMFSDGKVRVINFESELNGGVFEPLKDTSFFKSFIVRSEFGTLEWENGADFSPEFLYGAYDTE